MLFRFVILILFLSSLFISNGQVPDNIKGGYTICNEYHCSYKSGKIDSNSRHKLYTIKYNNNGLKTDYTEFSANGKIFSVKKYKYDNNGNKIEEVEYDELNKAFKKIEWIYSK